MVVPSTDQLVDMFNEMGCAPLLEKISTFKKNQLPDLLRYYFSIFLRCLSGRTSGLDSASISFQSLLYGIYYEVKLGCASILWADFCLHINHSLKGTDISNARFWAIVVHAHYQQVGYVPDPSLPEMNFTPIAIPTLDDVPVTFYAQIPQAMLSKVPMEWDEVNTYINTLVMPYPARDITQEETQVAPAKAQAKMKLNRKATGGPSDPKKMEKKRKASEQTTPKRKQPKRPPSPPPTTRPPTPLHTATPPPPPTTAQHTTSIHTTSSDVPPPPPPTTAPQMSAIPFSGIDFSFPEFDLPQSCLRQNPTSAAFFEALHMGPLVAEGPSDEELSDEAFCMCTRKVEQVCPLQFDPEIERTARKIRARRHSNIMSFSNISCSPEHVAQELSGEATRMSFIPPVSEFRFGSTSASGGAVSAPVPIPSCTPPSIPPVSQPQSTNPFTSAMSWGAPTRGGTPQPPQQQYQYPEVEEIYDEENEGWVPLAPQQLWDRGQGPPRREQQHQPLQGQQGYNDPQCYGNPIRPLYFAQPRGQSVASHFQPWEYDDSSPIYIPDGVEHYVEIRPQLIGILTQFRGYKTDDPYNHLYEFISIANANTTRNTNRDTFRLRLFPFTLTDKAKYWFTSLPSNSITRWDQLKVKFLQEFYLVCKTTKVRREIQTFQQQPGEAFHEAFDRLKELLRSCPHHEVPKWQLVKLFFEGVSETHQAMINASSSGTFMWQEPEDAWRFLDQLSLGLKVSGTMKDNTVYVANIEAESKWKMEIQKELSVVSKKFNEMLARFQQEKGAYVLHGQVICNTCRGIGHNHNECSMTHEEISQVHGYGRFHNAPRPFRSNQQREVRQQPMRQQQVQRPPPAGGMKIGIQEIFGMLVKLQEVEKSNSEAILKVGELVIKMEEDRPQEKAQASKVQVNEVITLRSGKKVDNKVTAPPVDEDSNVEIIFDEKEKLEKEEKKGKEEQAKNKKQTSTWEKGEPSRTVPFPTALEKPEKRPYRKKGPQAEDMWELFSQIKVNIPLVKLIKEVPAYTKFLKDMCIHKKHIVSHLPKMISLPENVSSILMDAFPPKMKDPGVPLISVDLGDMHIKRVLLYLGASVNILPGQLFDKHEFGTMRSTDVILQLADKSTKIPRGMLVDVIIKTKINIFNANAKGSSMEEEECYQVDIIDKIVHQYTPEVLQSEAMKIQEEGSVEDD
ncbi:hypothetical protein L2E82_29605 [Cichorium intybus]|uniref:Uncharacterized protein n=1 Tax=Cichorium intybus TaxID=13427 RepID=A0ACB9CYA8_CICIN|nr:hypothetical protein L2E82_29605 [Cichorium intybus]